MFDFQIKGETKMKKLIALLMCAAMLIALLAGCGGNNSDPAVSAEPTPEAEAAPEAVPQAAPEGPAAAPGEEEAAPEVYIMLGGTGYETYAPETVVGTAAGIDVTWQEYYYWLNYYASYYTQMASMYGQTLTSWDAVGELSSENANGAALTQLAQYTIRQYHAVTAAAAQAGITLTEEDQLLLDENIVRYGDIDGDGTLSEEELAQLSETFAAQNVDEAFVRNLDSVGILDDRLFEEYFGAEGEKCPDELIDAFITENGLLSAKHILLLTVDTATRESLSEDEIAQKLDTITTLYNELAAVQDHQPAMLALFDEYMADYSEDTGTAANPNGYTFVEGDMVDEFTDAVLGLDENYGLSGIVESSYGYHIILRQPVTRESVLLSGATVQYAVASEQFNAMLEAWTESADAQWNEGFASPDMQAIFG